jgi:hypothetical protein
VTDALHRQVSARQRRRARRVEPFISWPSRRWSHDFAGFVWSVWAATGDDIRVDRLELMAQQGEPLLMHVVNALMTSMTTTAPSMPSSSQRINWQPGIGASEQAGLLDTANLPG